MAGPSYGKKDHLKALPSDELMSPISSLTSRSCFPLQLKNFKVSAKLSDMNPLHAQWIVDLYNYMREEKDTIINGFKSAGVTEVIVPAEEIVTKVENPFCELSVLVSGMLYRFRFYYANARTICALLFYHTFKLISSTD